MLIVDKICGRIDRSPMAEGVTMIGQRRATLAGEVRSEIERLILTGALGSGAKLNEAALAGSMGVSRGTVREAIRSLADSGLIDLVANRGAFVHRLTIPEIRNLYDLRGAIFGMACARVTELVARDEAGPLLHALRGNLDEMRIAHAADDRDGYYRINIAFHDMLLAGARNAKAKAVYDGLVKEMHLFRRRGLSVALNIARSIDEHEAIVAAIEQGNTTAAREAALRHIESGLGRYMSTLADLADDGEADGDDAGARHDTAGAAEMT
jgi:DNA-binding GntR family transcriptional regulator